MVVATWQSHISSKDGMSHARMVAPSFFLFELSPFNEHFRSLKLTFKAESLRDQQLIP